MNFTFNGVASDSFGLKVKSSNHLSMPAKRIESIEIQGRTGNLIIDDGSFKNLSIEIICFLDCRETKNTGFIIRQIAKWLQTPVGYQDLIFSDGIEFKAVCTNQIDFEEMIDNFGELAIRFDAVEVSE